jgi:hypothetical protein
MIIPPPEPIAIKISLSEMMRSLYDINRGRSAGVKRVTPVNVAERDDAGAIIDAPRDRRTG